jgi:uncharacterized protein YndB with AHSA1/START domain
VSTTRTFRHIDAPREAIYRALLDAHSIEKWRAPVGMTCQVHELDAQEGGFFRVSLTYDVSTDTGKTSKNTDTYQGHFEKLVPNELVVELIEFETTDPGLRGQMRMTTTLADAKDGTDVIVVHEGIPTGVSTTDNETGTKMSLDKLAATVETARTHDSLEDHS